MHLDAYRQVKGKLNVEFEDLGEQKVKNIADPVLTYRVDFGKYVAVRGSQRLNSSAEGSSRRLATASFWNLPVLSKP